MNRSTGFMLAAGVLLAVPAAWTAEKKEATVTMDQLPKAVRSTIEKESAGARVAEIEKETEAGKTFYEAEIVKNGHQSYVHVAENGKVLKRESAAQEHKDEAAETKHHTH
jgi:uncharacterized membrane protein YkoI